MKASKITAAEIEGGTIDSAKHLKEFRARMAFLQKKPSADNPAQCFIRLEQIFDKDPANILAKGNNETLFMLGKISGDLSKFLKRLAKQDKKHCFLGSCYFAQRDGVLKLFLFDGEAGSLNLKLLRKGIKGLCKRIGLSPGHVILNGEDEPYEDEDGNNGLVEQTPVRILDEEGNEVEIGGQNEDKIDKQTQEEAREKQAQVQTLLSRMQRDFSSLNKLMEAVMAARSNLTEAQKAVANLHGGFKNFEQQLQEAENLDKNNPNVLEARKSFEAMQNSAKTRFAALYKPLEDFEQEIKTFNERLKTMVANLDESFLIKL